MIIIIDIDVALDYYGNASQEMKILFNTIKEVGFNILFLTAKDTVQQDARKKLNNAGYRDPFIICCISPKERVLLEQSAHNDYKKKLTLLSEWKKKQLKKISRKYDIVSTVSNYHTDLQGAYTGKAFRFMQQCSNQDIFDLLGIIQ